MIPNLHYRLDLKEDLPVIFKTKHYTNATRNLLYLVLIMIYWVVKIKMVGLKDITYKAIPTLHFRRPVALRVRDIGIWLQIMESVGRIAVVTNVSRQYNRDCIFTFTYFLLMVYIVIYNSTDTTELHPQNWCHLVSEPINILRLNWSCRIT